MKIRLTIIFALIGSGLLAQLPSDTFKLANDAFDRGAIDDAIQLYQNIADNNFSSPALYFNLGTAYIEKRKWAEARYYLEKAAILDPLNADIKHNLSYVQEQIDDLYEFPYFPFNQTIEFIHSKAGWNVISIALLVVFLLALATAWIRTGQWRPVLYSLVILWVFLLGLFLLERNYLKLKQRMGVVWESQIELREKPDEFGESLAMLPAGFKVRILEQVGPWCRVDLADGSSGWILQESIKLL